MTSNDLANLRKMRWILVLSAWGIAGLVWNVHQCNEKRQQKRASEAFRQRQTEHVQHLALHDYLKFQASLEPSRHQYPDYAHMSGKVVRIDGDRIWLRITEKSDFKNTRDLIQYFAADYNHLDTVMVTRQAILGAIRRDTLHIPAPDGRTGVLSDLLEVQRLDGPLVELNGYSNQSITLRCEGINGHFTAIEAIKGSAEPEKPLPQALEDRSRIVLKTQSAETEMTCNLILNSEFNDRIVYTVQRTQGNQVTVKRQFE